MAPGVTPCARCGSSIADGSRFCPSCGAPVADARREERRIVTVVFGDLAGFTELSEGRDAEEVKGVVDAEFDHLASLIGSFGGRVDKVIGDEIMAVFGAPQAHEDDPERAVRAALAIQRRLADDSAVLEVERGITLRMHIGINTGEAIAGFVGGSDSYSVVGDAVNTARRIQEAAHAGQILVGDSTREATSDAITYRRVGPITAKGKALPVAVWEAVSERGLPGERPPREAPLIGREEELTLLEATAAIVRRDRSPTMVTLVGEAGLGKSRVADEFAKRAHAGGWRVLGGRSLPYGSSSPAYEVEEMLRAALALDRGGEDELGELKERLDTFGLAAEADVLAPFLGIGGSMPSRAADAPGRSSGPGREAGIALDAARRVLERIAETEDGLVLVFHDLHWGDDAVLAFARSLLTDASGPMFMLSLARGALLERVPDWGQPVGSVLLRLQPLPRDRAAEMLDVFSPELPLGTREAVLDRAGGNPFYLEELARLLTSRPVDGTDAWVVPSGVQALVAARIDGLPDRTKRLLQDAAVIGEEFWPGALVALDADPAGLELPEMTELIERVPSGVVAGEPAFRFRQTLVRDVAYAAVPKNQRARQHAVIAGWLEGVSGDERELIALIAHHYERAASLAREIGTPDPAVEAHARELLERAGDQSLALDASRNATRFFKRALPFARDDEDALGLRLRLGEALVGSWRHEEATEQLEEALAEARRLGDRRAETRSLRLLGDSWRMRGQGDRAREPLDLALKIAKEIGADREEAEGLRARGQLDLFQGRWGSSILWFRQALARFRALEDKRGEGWTLQNLGWASMFVAKLDDALAYLTDGEAIFAEIDDEEGAGWCMGMRGWVQLLRGEVMEAGRIAETLETYLAESRPEYLDGAGFTLDLQRILRSYVEVLRCHFESAIALAESALSNTTGTVGTGWVDTLAHYPPFLSALLQRRFEVARESMEAGIRGAEAMGDPFYLALSHFARALYGYETGDTAGAEAALARISGDDEAGQVWGGNTGVLYLRACLARARGDLTGALAELEQRERGQGISLISPARTRVLASEVLTELGRLDEAIVAANEAIARSGEETLSRVLGLRALATAQIESGAAAEAEAAIRDELQILDETDWTVERVRALSVLSRALDEQRRYDEAAETLDRARELLDAMPGDRDLDPVRAMLGS